MRVRKIKDFSTKRTNTMSTVRKLFFKALESNPEIFTEIDIKPMGDDVVKKWKVYLREKRLDHILDK